MQVTLRAMNHILHLIRLLTNFPTPVPTRPNRPNRPKPTSTLRPTSSTSPFPWAPRRPPLNPGHVNGLPYPLTRDLAAKLRNSTATPSTKHSVKDFKTTLMRFPAPLPHLPPFLPLSRTHPPFYPLSQHSTLRIHILTTKTNTLSICNTLYEYIIRVHYTSTL